MKNVPQFFAYSRKAAIKELSAGQYTGIQGNQEFCIPKTCKIAVMDLPTPQNDVGGKYAAFAAGPEFVEALLQWYNIPGAQSFRPRQKWDFQKQAIYTGQRGKNGAYEGLRLGKEEFSTENEIQRFFRKPIFLFRTIEGKETLYDILEEQDFGEPMVIRSPKGMILTVQDLTNVFHLRMYGMPLEIRRLESQSETYLPNPAP